MLTSIVDVDVDVDVDVEVDVVDISFRVTWIVAIGDGY